MGQQPVLTGLLDRLQPLLAQAVLVSSPWRDVVFGFGRSRPPTEDPQFQS